jgi:hypothetical protein
MSKLKYRIAYYAVLHFLTDFLCAAFVTGTLVQNGADLYTVLIYNLCAFALQFVVGALFDVRGISSGGAVAAFFVLTASFVLKDIPYAAAAAAGIGNSLFHVGAGRDILLRDRKNCTPLGIFICPGAVGIFLGVIAGNGHLISLWVLGILAAAGAFFAWQVYRQNPGPAAGNEPAEAGTSGTHAAAVPASGFRSAAVLIPLLCLLAVVILRSYMGAHQDFAWKKTVSDSACVLAALVLGKAFGGIFADRIGKKAFSVISLAAAAVFFAFSGLEIFGLAAVFLFNMTMPVTMRGAAEWLPGREGTSFGFLSFGLFLGMFLDRYLLGGISPFAGFSILASLLSAVLLIIGLKKENGAAS